MKTRKSSPRARTPKTSRLISTLLVLVLGLSCHSYADIPSGRELASASVGLEKFARELGMAVRDRANKPDTPKTPDSVAAPGAHAGQSRQTGDSFSGCRQLFAGDNPPVLAHRPTNRALCYDAFAILHSGESKTAVFVAQKLNRASVADADEKRSDKFFADARLRSVERATLEDYKGSGWSRGHLAPAGDMPTSQAMAQSFSLANMVPQAAKHNGGAWAHSVESATRKYAGRATGNVYVITGPVFEPSIKQSPAIGPGQVRVPKYLFKLVYDQDKNRAWAHWHFNDDSTRASRPISYGELVSRTGIEFLPGLHPDD